MGYERNDRRYGFSDDRTNSGGDRGRSYGGPSHYGADRGNEDRNRSYADYGGSIPRDYRGEQFDDRSDDRRALGGDPRGYDRGFFDRAGDEVRSWFGDEEAERRRQQDDRLAGTEYRGHNQRSGYRSRHDHDPNYRTWRDRQLESLDRDYDDYRREHQSRFDSEFGSWRQSRQGQRDQLTRVQEHQEVVGSDGEHIGTVDHVRGDRILLTKSDQAAGGRHHSIPSSWIASVDDKVTLAKTADQAKQHWRDEARDEQGGLFGNDRDANFSRTFSGTY